MLSRNTNRFTLADRPDLRPVLLALKHWGDEHVTGRVMPPVYEHTCGAVFEPRTHCAACGEALQPRDLSLAVPAQSPADAPAQ